MLALACSLQRAQCFGPRGVISVHSRLLACGQSSEPALCVVLAVGSARDTTACSHCLLASKGVCTCCLSCILCLTCCSRAACFAIAAHGVVGISFLMLSLFTKLAAPRQCCFCCSACARYQTPAHFRVAACSVYTARASSHTSSVVSLWFPCRDSLGSVLIFTACCASHVHSTVSSACGTRGISSALNAQHLLPVCRELALGD